MDNFYNSFSVINGVANFTNCSRCGQAIKYVFEWRGKPYGSECIQVVTGEKADYWLTKYENGKRVIDEVATEERDANREAERARFAKMQEERNAIALWSATNNKWLIDSLSQEYGDFCSSMIEDLSKRPLNYENFTQRQISIMADIYAKQSGRRNSKAYNSAYDDFYSRIPE